MKKTISILAIIILLALPIALATIDENGTVTCPTGTDDVQNICHIIQGPAAGLGIFIQYMGTPVGTLVTILVFVGVLMAIGMAIAFAVKKVMRSD